MFSLSVRMGQRIDVCRSSTHVDFCARQSSTTAIVNSWGLTYQLPSFATFQAVAMLQTFATTSGSPNPMSSAAVTSTRFQAY